MPVPKRVRDRRTGADTNENGWLIVVKRKQRARQLKPGRQVRPGYSPERQIDAAYNSNCEKRGDDKGHDC